MPCDAGMLAKNELFEQLTEEDRTQLALVVDRRELPAGTTLFQAGEPGESLFVVSAGEGELFIKDTAGQKIVLTVAREGEIFGELALLDEGARTATAIALVDSEMLELDRDELRMVFQKNPDCALGLLAAMGRMTRKADALLQERVSRNANIEAEEHISPIQRIADWI